MNLARAGHPTGAVQSPEEGRKMITAGWIALGLLAIAILITLTSNAMAGARASAMCSYIAKRYESVYRDVSWNGFP